MIVTVTPAPAIDWTAHVKDFVFGAVNRIDSSTREPNGKGLNVSWALHRAEVPTVAVFPGGGETAGFMARKLSEADLEHVLVPTALDVRTNLTLVTEGEPTKLNEPGVPLTEEQSTALVDAALEAGARAQAILLCGSHPAGFTGEHVSRLIEGAHAAGVECVVDTSGAALEHVIPLRPDLIKPNVHELAELRGRDLRTMADVVAAARETCADGTKAVLASLGPDGAVYVSADRVVLAQARDVPFINSVGAGDALLAGFMSHDGDAADRLASAVLWASSAVACPTTLFPVRDELRERITVTEWDGAEIPLSEPGLAPTA